MPGLGLTHTAPSGMDGRGGCGTSCATAICAAHSTMSKQISFTTVLGVFISCFLILVFCDYIEAICRITIVTIIISSFESS
jgi:hypothetical protein